MIVVIKMDGKGFTGIKLQDKHGSFCKSRYPCGCLSISSLVIKSVFLACLGFLLARAATLPRHAIPNITCSYIVVGSGWPFPLLLCSLRSSRRYCRYPPTNHPFEYSALTPDISIHSSASRGPWPVECLCDQDRRLT